MSAATSLKNVKVFVLANDANGAPSIVHYSIEVDGEKYDSGKHYDAALSKAEADGYTKGVAFDENDPAGRWVLQRIAGQSEKREKAAAEGAAASTAPPALNQAQKVLLKSYAESEFVHLLACSTVEQFRAELDQCGDGLLRYLVDELDEVEGCETLGDAQDRVSTSINQLEELMQHLSDAEKDKQSASRLIGTLAPLGLTPPNRKPTMSKDPSDAAGLGAAANADRPDYASVLESIAQRNPALSDQERGHLMDAAAAWRKGLDERAAQLAALDSARGALSIVKGALDDASSVVDKSDDEAFAYEHEIGVVDDELARLEARLAGRSTSPTAPSVGAPPAAPTQTAINVLHDAAAAARKVLESQESSGDAIRNAALALCDAAESGIPTLDESGLSIKDRLDRALAGRPYRTADGTPGMFFDIDEIDWLTILHAATESKWMPKEYIRNDWISDVCSWLREGPPQNTDGNGGVILKKIIRDWSIAADPFTILQEAGGAAENPRLAPYEIEVAENGLTSNQVMVRIAPPHKTPDELDGKPCLDISVEINDGVPCAHITHGYYDGEVNLSVFAMPDGRLVVRPGDHGLGDLQPYDEVRNFMPLDDATSDSAKVSAPRPRGS